MQPYSTRHISEMMASQGVRPSAQRIAILRYLMEHPVHPTAEEIHQNLIHEMPTLSLTTVYNTLKLMASHNVVDILCIDPRNAHFDYPTHPHAHMWCRECGKIFDAPLTADIDTAHDLEGFRIEGIDLYYKGICGECSCKTN